MNRVTIRYVCMREWRTASCGRTLVDARKPNMTDDLSHMCLIWHVIWPYVFPWPPSGAHFHTQTGWESLLEEWRKTVQVRQGGEREREGEAIYAPWLDLSLRLLQTDGLASEDVNWRARGLEGGRSRRRGQGGCCLYLCFIDHPWWQTDESDSQGSEHDALRTRSCAHTNTCNCSHS